RRLELAGLHRHQAAEDVHQDEVGQLHRAGREVGFILRHRPVDAALVGGVIAGPDEGQQAVPAGADGFMLLAGEPARRGDDQPAALIAEGEAFQVQLLVEGFGCHARPCSFSQATYSPSGTTTRPRSGSWVLLPSGYSTSHQVPNLPLSTTVPMGPSGTFF